MDRLVRQISPTVQGEASQQKSFSEFLTIPNLVLLGNPGAGKTFLFERAASAQRAEYVRARTFLTRPTNKFSKSTCLFIDALDERRSSRSDDNTVDQIITKLFEIEPAQVRISCRAIDWQGETDLVAFREYFDRNGGCAVVALDALSKQEQHVILRAQGIDSPSDFIREAERRNLEMLLDNPQNLIMLTKVVKGGDWPATKCELFRLCSEFLLSEHNRVHAQRDVGQYTHAELLEEAGFACAVRLISDIGGISCAGSLGDGSLPSSRDLAKNDPKKLDAAIGRRIFVAGDSEGTTDYAHRTIAEYVGAQQLADIVRRGLPLGRLKALLGRDDVPATELRGLHSWLPVFLSEHAEDFIEADPFGVLCYGDAASLSAISRKHLLHSLSRLADSDPAFREGLWQPLGIGSLSQPDMESDFREILDNPDSPYVLRSIVLDALVEGTLIPGLLPELERIARNKTRPYSERESAIEALSRPSEANNIDLNAIYAGLGNSRDDIRLRGWMIRNVVALQGNTAAIAGLMNDVLTCTEHLVTGSLWRLEEGIACANIPDLINAIVISENIERTAHNAFEVVHILDALLLRFVEQQTANDAPQLLKLLKLKQKFKEFGYASNRDILAKALSDRKLSEELAVAEVSSWSDDEENYLYRLHKSQEATLHTIDPETILYVVITSISTETGKKKIGLYEVAFYLLCQISTSSSTSFENWYAMGEAEPLKQARDALCISIIPNWRIEMAEEDAKRKAEIAERKAANRAQFDNDRQQIESGIHLSWLSWLAETWYGSLEDTDGSKSPIDRLEDELESGRALSALAGLIRFIHSGYSVALVDVLKLRTEGKYQPIWRALLCSLDLTVKNKDDLARVAPDLLQSALAIAIYLPVYWRDGNNLKPIEHVWVDLAEQTQSKMCADIYLEIAQNDLRNKTECVLGLSWFLARPDLAQFHAGGVALLLKEFPTMPPSELSDLLARQLAVGDVATTSTLVAKGTAATQSTETASHHIWLAAGFLISPEAYRSQIDSLIESDKKEVFWAIFGFSEHPRARSDQKRLALTTTQTENTLRLVTPYFPPSYHPEGGWSGSRNPWDASDAIRGLITRIASNTSFESTQTLHRLLESKECSSYRDVLKHAFAQHRRRRLDVEFRQPSWRETVNTLRNGYPANIIDLQALVSAHIEDLHKQLTGANTDSYKRYWNEDSYGRHTNPKNEASARNALVEMMKEKLAPFEISVDPEGHMANSNRADIVFAFRKMKLVAELKRDYHSEVWTAIDAQLDRSYTITPETEGHGLYIVFWYGKDRPQAITRPPQGIGRPNSAKEMEEQLIASLSPDQKKRIRVFVLDVSGSVSS